MPKLQVEIGTAGVAGVGNCQFIDVVAGNEDIFFHRSNGDGVGDISPGKEGIRHEFSAGNFKIGRNFKFKLLGGISVKVGESGAVFEPFKALKLAI